MQETLNTQVIEAAKCIAKLMPSYIQSVQIEEKEGFVEVLLGNPSQQDKPIWLSTNGEEITFSFAESHFHINEYSDEVVPENLVEEMVSSIIRLVTGVDLTYSAWKDERSLGGGFLESKPALIEINNTFIKANQFKVWGWSIEDNQVINTYRSDK